MATGDGVIQASLVIALGASVSDSCRIPRNSGTVTVFMPAALAVPDAQNYGSDEYISWKIQTMLPVANSSSADEVTWADSSYISPESPQLVRYLIFPFAANTALSFPTWMLGGGKFRINTIGVTQPAETTFTVYFSGFYN